MTDLRWDEMRWDEPSHQHPCCGAQRHLQDSSAVPNLHPGAEDSMPKPWPGMLKACLLHLPEGKPRGCSSTSSQRKADKLDLEVMVNGQNETETGFWFTSKSSFICYQSPRKISFPEVMPTCTVACLCGSFRLGDRKPQPRIKLASRHHCNNGKQHLWSLTNTLPKSRKDLHPGKGQSMSSLQKPWQILTHSCDLCFAVFTLAHLLHLLSVL